MFLEHNKDIQAVASDYYLVDDKENIISKENSIKKPIGCAIMFRIESLIDIGLYNKSFKLHEEKELMSRFLKKHKIARLPIPLYRYRRHKNNITNKKADYKKHLKRLELKLKK